MTPKQKSVIRHLAAGAKLHVRISNKSLKISSFPYAIIVLEDGFRDRIATTVISRLIRDDLLMTYQETKDQRFYGLTEHGREVAASI